MPQLMLLRLNAFVPDADDRRTVMPIESVSPSLPPPIPPLFQSFSPILSFHSSYLPHGATTISFHPFLPISSLLFSAFSFLCLPSWHSLYLSFHPLLHSSSSSRSCPSPASIPRSTFCASSSSPAYLCSLRDPIVPPLHSWSSSRSCPFSLSSSTVPPSALLPLPLFIFVLFILLLFLFCTQPPTIWSPSRLSLLSATRPFSFFYCISFYFFWRLFLLLVVLMFGWAWWSLGPRAKEMFGSSSRPETNRLVCHRLSFHADLLTINTTDRPTHLHINIHIGLLYTHSLQCHTWQGEIVIFSCYYSSSILIFHQLRLSLLFTFNPRRVG